MEIKFKRLSDKAVLPIRAHKSDAGLDLTATDIKLELNERNQTIIVYHTDLAVEIPEGYVGLLFPRSNISNKTLTLTNCVGVIDSGYRGEILAKFRNTTDVVPSAYNVGEKFAQLLIMPLADITVAEAADLSESERGEGGFGSTDEKEVSAAAGSDSETAESSDQTVPEQAADLKQSETAA